MKHIDRNAWYRLFCYALILGIMLILHIHEKSNALFLFGLSFLAFSNIEESVSDLNKKFSLITILKNPFFGNFLSNIFGFLSLLCFIGFSIFLTFN